MSINLNPVQESSNIAAEGYSADGEILRIQFLSGSQYDYHGVTPEAYKAFIESPSRGEYLAKVIKPACPASKVKGDENASQ